VRYDSSGRSHGRLGRRASRKAATPEIVDKGELAVFEGVEQGSRLEALEDTGFILGSGVSTPTDLVLGNYFRHTSQPAARPSAKEKSRKSASASPRRPHLAVAKPKIREGETTHDSKYPDRLHEPPADGALPDP